MDIKIKNKFLHFKAFLAFRKMNIQAGSSYIHNPVPNPPVVAQPARSMGPQEVGFMRGYVFSFVGLLRFGLIVKN